MNAVGANTIIDDGGGVKVSGSTLAIYKVDGGAVWKTASACNGVSIVNTSTTPAVGATYYDLEIFCENFDGVTMEASFKVDGVFLKDTNGNVIRHVVPIASSALMQLWVGAKLGAITNNDTTLVDYLYELAKPGLSRRNDSLLCGRQRQCHTHAVEAPIATSSKSTRQTRRARSVVSRKRSRKRNSRPKNSTLADSLKSARGSACSAVVATTASLRPT